MANFFPLLTFPPGPVFETRFFHSFPLPILKLKNDFSPLSEDSSDTQPSMELNIPTIIPHFHVFFLNVKIDTDKIQFWWGDSNRNYQESSTPDT